MVGETASIVMEQETAKTAVEMEKSPAHPGGVSSDLAQNVSMGIRSMEKSAPIVMAMETAIPVLDGGAGHAPRAQAMETVISAMVAAIARSAAETDIGKWCAVGFRLFES